MIGLQKKKVPKYHIIMLAVVLMYSTVTACKSFNLGLFM